MAKKEGNDNFSFNTKLIYFLAAFNVIGLAIGSVFGISAVSLSKSLTNDILMPIIEPLMGTTNWKNYRLKLWVFDLGIGPFISELMYFILISLLMYFIIKVIFKSYIDKIIERKHRWNKGLKNSQSKIIDILSEIKRS